MQAYYITTARELARMVGIRKAPILHHFSESISGASTIRCFNQEDRFMNRNISLIDDYSRVAFHNSSTMEWLCVRINFLFNLVFFLLLVILVNLPRSAIDPSKFWLLLEHNKLSNYKTAWASLWIIVSNSWEIKINFLLFTRSSNSYYHFYVPYKHVFY